MTTSFTCPHCGRRTSTERTDVEFVDLGNGTTDALFPAIGPDEERHINQRLCCAECYARAGARLQRDSSGRVIEDHPYDVKSTEARRKAGAIRR